MQTKNRKISTLIENQLPGFISTEYENFSKFVEKYYEHLESQGNVLDIVSNITKYRDIDFYEENLLKQYTEITASIDSDDTVITVADASSFPEKNGYIKIDDEICFYKERTDTQFLNVSRGVSGNTTLGDLYDKTTFVTTEADDHQAGALVYNISNLFLYAFVKNFETQYLGAFPEKYLKGEVDKRTLIKNISSFYKTKGTDTSIKFIFNSIISRDPEDIPEVYNPKDFTLKSSTSDWISTYSLKVKILAGNPQSLIGQQIVQSLDPTKSDILYASAFVDNVIYKGIIDGEEIYEVILDVGSINGKFEIASKTKLKTQISSLSSTGDRIDVGSTLGWRKEGRLLIDNEEIYYNDKNVNQFVIERRGTPPSVHQVGANVYNFSTVESSGVKILVLGVLYNLKLKNAAPYSIEGEKVQVSQPGFISKHPAIYDKSKDQIRWKLNEVNTRPSVPLNAAIQSAIQNLNANISAIYEDDQYFYICTSGFPSTQILTATTSLIPEDQKILRLIRKNPTTTTEIYSTSTRDVGIFVDGSLVFGCKDTDYVSYGAIVNYSIKKRGSGYKKAPYVLINNQPGKARAVLTGDVLESIIIDTDEVFTANPTVTVTAGRGAQVSAIVTNGVITSLVVANPGEYYSSSPRVVITDLAGKGRFAEYRANISIDGKIIDFEKIDGGKFYTQENVLVEIIEDANGSEAEVEVEIKKWVKDRYRKIQTSLDDNNGYLFENYVSTQSTDKSYGYGVVANPKRLRASIGDNLSNTFVEPGTPVHSPILGYAYDGNPIYGPFGYNDPTDPTSGVSKLQSGYVLRSSRINGPSTSQYPLGTFVDDYVWNPSIDSEKTVLDKNNGRFCVTPDYPEGVYAYFITLNSLTNAPTFPYILGENYYSLPVDSNYNSPISQDDLPKNVKRLSTANIEKNGDGTYALIESISSGSISSAKVDDSTNTFSVGSQLIVNEEGTAGTGLNASVSSVEGNNVVSLEALETKAIKVDTIDNCYFFAGTTITQTGSGASGQLIGNVFNDNTLILRNVSGNFNKSGLLSSATSVISVLIDQNSSYTKGSSVSLTDGINDPIATGEILETTVSQNSVKIKVNSGSFVINDDYFIKSGNLNDTTGSRIISIQSLSQGIRVNSVQENIAIVETDANHNLTNGDSVEIDIVPDDLETETTYYVRKRYYQKVTLSEQKISAFISDSGLGRINLLNSGLDYQSGTYTNVELIFQDSSKARTNVGQIGATNNARATIVVSNISGSGYGKVVSVQITSKGSGYKKGDILTVADSSLNRLGSSVSTQRIALFVDHVGFAKENTILKLNQIVGISVNDTLVIGAENVKVTSVNQSTKELTVLRAQNNTVVTDHFDNKEVSNLNTEYRFNIGLQFLGNGPNDPYVVAYNKQTQELLVSYAYTVANPTQVVRSNTFYDVSTPQKLVKISSVEDVEYRLEFSKNNTNFVTNPIIDIQKYYSYKFDTSHISMANSYLDFSSSQNYNIVTNEKEVSDIEPGNTGAYVRLKLGFGPKISSNNFDTKVPVNFKNYFYFIKSDNNIRTNGGYLNVVNDPLSGSKKVIYSTPTKFVYEYTGTPQYDGSGSITYTTTGSFAIGKIASIVIENSGQDYKKLPIVSGVTVSPFYESSVQVNYNAVEKKINSVTVISAGSNYSKPKAVVVDGDGTGAEFEIVTLNGKINRVIVVDGGKNYTYAPKVRIVETDIKIYFASENIGIPQTIKIVENGGSFHADKSEYSSYTSTYSLLVTNHEDNAFYAGEKVVQIDQVNGQNVVVASGFVAKNGWRVGGNILKLENISGVFDTKLPIKGLSKNKTASIVSILYSEFEPDVRTYFDNIGAFQSDKGKIGISSQKLQDSYFYQDYSYVIKSRTAISVWRDLIKETVHPAGFRVFGEMVVESEGSTKMPSTTTPIAYVSTINLAPKTVTVVDTRRYITESIVKFDNLNIERGIGSVSIDTFDNSETISGELVLNTAFNGSFDPSTGQVVGNRTFVLIDKKNNLPYVPYNEYHLVITLDGVLQEPGVAYTVDGSLITFATAPFGQRTAEGQIVPPQRFYCRTIKFKDNTLNERYFRKIRSISGNFDGVKSDFDLYYEDGTPVKTEVGENLIVTLNGVLQNARKNETEPLGNAYYILRNQNPSVADKIVFTKPPINHEDLYDNIEDELAGAEKSFIYGIGSYERLTIDNKLIPFVSGGPYLILDEVSKTVRKVDDSNYVLVFIDGVLQIQNESYVIVGPTISFTKPLNYYIDENGEEIYPNVSIILLYGRNLNKTLTFYDFEPDTYYNKVNLRITGSGTYDQFIEFMGDTPYSEVFVYQDDQVLGKLRSYKKVSSSVWDLLIVANNVSYNSALPLKFNTNPDLNTPAQLVLSGITVEQSYEQNSESERILSRSGTRFLYGTEYDDKSWFEQNRLTANLLPGDLIKIDGESDFREILSIPFNVRTKQFNDNQQVSNEIYAKIAATNYNGTTRGEGLSITATVRDGKVVSLAWNRRDLQIYFNNQILLQPTAYQYFTTPILHFIPIDGNGGGAKAQVIIKDGQVIDVILTHEGEGYTSSPKVVVARGYDRIKNNSRKIDSVTYINVSGFIVGTELVFSSSVEIIGARIRPDVVDIISLGGFLEQNTDRQITQIILPKSSEVRISAERIFSPRIQNINIAANINSISSITKQITRITDVPFGMISTFESFQDSSLSREIVTIIDGVINEPKVYIPYSSINEVGAFLDADMSETDTVLYTANTSKFPAQGKLLVGTEIVYYESKSFNRFIGLQRGVDGTTAQQHFAGDYFRTLPELVSVVPVGATLNIQSEFAVRSSDTVSTSIVKTINIDNTELSEIDYSIEIAKFYKTGVLDYYVEPVPLSEEVGTRSGIVVLEPEINEVFFRDGSTIFVRNLSITTDDYYISYQLGNAGYNLRNFERNIFNDYGSSSVSKLTFAEIDAQYPELTIRDFEDRGNSTILLSGTRFNLVPPSIQNSVVKVTSNTNLTSTTTLNVTGSTALFPSSGYLFQGSGSNWSVIQYTGKTSSSFTGCTLIRGSSTLNANNEVIPYSIG